MFLSSKCCFASPGCVSPRRKGLLTLGSRTASVDGKCVRRFASQSTGDRRHSSYQSVHSTRPPDTPVIPLRVMSYRRVDNSRPVFCTVSAWEWIYATNLPRLQRETSKMHVREAHSVLTTAILLPQRLSCYWGKRVLLRMLTNLRLADLCLATAQQRSTGQNLQSDLHISR
jgi:hypothetical protein